MPSKIARHGTQRGYVAEIAHGKACPRCQAAHRVYQRQFQKNYKAKGIKYSSDQVLDQLDQQPAATTIRPAPTTIQVQSAGNSAELEDEGTPTQPSLAERMSRLIGQVKTPEPDNEYVNQEESHEYIREIEHDPEPAGDGQWEALDDAEIIINEAGLKKIQENLGFYLVTVGMTLEILDPYCGSIAAEHADEMIEHWSKVIAHYPGIAKHFLTEKGGVIFAWINALQATWPVLKGIYNHHLAHTVKVENGIIYRVTKEGTKQPMPDATMPPMPDSYQYSTR